MSTEPTATSNLELARRYLRILERDMADPELPALFDPEYVFHEKPNRLNPNGRTLTMSAMHEVTAKAKRIVLEQSYVIKNALAVGDEVALEVDWVGRFNLAFASTPAGAPIRATLGMFLTFRAGKILSQRNYDCYDPF
jgi:ketosteroid isomerase-like protein